MCGEIDLVVLAGGAATRLSSLGAIPPKPLLPVGGRPFLAWPLAKIAHTVALRRIILSTRKGQGDVFVHEMKKIGYLVEINEEDAPMGTGGAILSACAGAVTDPVLAMNGDVWFDMDAAALVDAARHTGAAMAAIAVPDSNRFGVLDVGDNGIVRAFHEKRGGPQPRPGLINAGLYAFTRGALERFSVRACSFEHDIAPALAASGTLSAVRATGDFIDIGTPENYARAESVVGATQHNPPAMMAGEI